MSGNRGTTLWTRSRCHGSEDFVRLNGSFFFSHYNRLIKFFSQGAPVCVGKTKVCCCSHTGQHDNEVWGKIQQKSPFLDVCRVFRGRWERKGTAQIVIWGLSESPTEMTLWWHWFFQSLYGSIFSQESSPWRFSLLDSSVPAVLSFLLLCISAVCQEIPAPGVKC